MFLLIDNFDSFTYNLVQAFESLGVQPRVLRNDQKELLSLAQDPELQGIVISPGPGGPEDTGQCLAVLKSLPARIPVLGVCLGFHTLAHFAGYPIIRANRIMHGKTSSIHHSQTGIFRDLESPFSATRYHSLLMDTDKPPEPGLKITAKSEDNEPMGLEYPDRPWMGVQFHPESILTVLGNQLLYNFYRITVNLRDTNSRADH